MLGRGWTLIGSCLLNVLQMRVEGMLLSLTSVMVRVEPPEVC